MECNPNLGGRQMLCPACEHRIVIPVMRGHPAGGHRPPVAATWDTSVPRPWVDVPTRYRDPAVNTPWL